MRATRIGIADKKNQADRDAATAMRPLSLDASTLLFSASLVGFLAAALTFSLARAGGHARQAVIAWSQGMLCVGITLLLAFLKTLVPDYAYLVIGNASIMAFALLVLLAYARLFGASFPARSAWSLYFAQCCVIVALYLAGAPRSIAVVTLCSFLAAELVLTAALVIRHGDRAARSVRWVAAATVALLGGLFAVRAAFALYGEVASVAATAQSHVQIATLVATSVGLIGSTIAFVTMVQDSQHRDALESARRDSLTGVLTRRAFFDELAALERQPGARYALVMVDVDHFKSINDEHGHAGGDAVLACVGALLRHSIRSTDAAGRYGGEEFCILLRDCVQADARHFSERLVEAAANAPVRTPQGTEVRFTLSAGYAQGVLGREHADEVRAVRRVLECADSALYAAKRAGRNRAAGAAASPPASARADAALLANIIIV